MKKIALLNCLKANRVCTGASCFKAFHDRTRSFERYRDKDVCLVAFMRCNGCDKDPLTDEGILEKVERLEKEGVEVVHVGACTKTREGGRCPTIQKIMGMMEEHGIELIDGTH